MTNDPVSIDEQTYGLQVVQSQPWIAILQPCT
jgi:hypothetical protein